MRALAQAHIVEMTPYLPYSDDVPALRLTHKHVEAIAAEADRAIAAQLSATDLRSTVDALTSSYDMERLGLHDYPHADISVSGLALRSELESSEADLSLVAGHVRHSRGPDTLEHTALAALLEQKRRDPFVAATLTALRESIPRSEASALPTVEGRAAAEHLYRHVLQSLQAERLPPERLTADRRSEYFRHAVAALRAHRNLASSRSLIANELADVVRLRRNAELRQVAKQLAYTSAYALPTAGLVASSVFTGRAIHVSKRIDGCVNSKVAACPIVPTSAQDVGVDQDCVARLRQSCMTSIGQGAKHMSDDAYTGAGFAMFGMISGAVATTAMAGLHFKRALAAFCRASNLQAQHRAILRQAIQDSSG